MRIIGLTGGIACGKSNVSQNLRSLGAFIVDGDELSRRLTAPGGEALPAIRARFGERVFGPDGVLNRRALAGEVFGHPEALEALDRIMQPLIRRLIDEAIEAARAGGAPVCVLDMPLLYEKGLDALCDRVWCVSLPHDMQLARLMERDHLTLPQAKARLASQMPPHEKARRAQVVIDTSRAISYTNSMIPALYAQELALAASAPAQNS